MTARIPDLEQDTGNPELNKASTSQMSGEKGQKKGKRPGRKPVKIDVKAKLERSRQSARECRARKKLRYQYIEELVANREKAVFALREELQMYKDWCEKADQGIIVDELKKLVLQEREQEEAKMLREQLQSYAPLTNINVPMNTYGPVCNESINNIFSNPNQCVTSTTSFLPFATSGHFTNVNSVAYTSGASNAVLDEDTNSRQSYMSTRPDMSQLSEKEQIHSWYLFLKGDESRFQRDGSGSGTPPSGDVSTSNRTLPSVVTDFLDISGSSSSSSSCDL